MHNKDENDQNVIFTQKSDVGNTTSWLFLDCLSLSQWNNRVLGDGVVVMNLNRLDTFFRESITNGPSTKNT